MMINSSIFWCGDWLILVMGAFLFLVLFLYFFKYLDVLMTAVVVVM